MPNGVELNEQLEFEERMRALSSEERQIFISKQVYALNDKFGELETKIDSISVIGVSKKTSALSGGITGGIIAGIITAVEYLTKRSS